jgi:hypothetical protein
MYTCYVACEPNAVNANKIAPLDFPEDLFSVRVHSGLQLHILTLPGALKEKLHSL